MKSSVKAALTVVDCCPRRRAPQTAAAPMARRTFVFSKKMPRQ
jgi:hypothetical protein